MSRALLLFLSFILLPVANIEYVRAQGCPEWAQQSAGVHRFRSVGEIFEIPLIPSKARERGQGESREQEERLTARCQPVTLDLQWSNGRNNGSNLSVTFFDNNNVPVYSKRFSAFLTGTRHFSLTSLDQQRGLRISSPSRVTVQAVAPFALPATVSYIVTYVGRAGRRDNEAEQEAGADVPASDKNIGGRGEVVQIRSASRLIGSSRVELVQIELKTERPLPVSDIPLRLRIGKHVFVDELWGDHTGRKMTLSLTPESFAALEDGAEILAFFNKSDQEVWRFGKLDKSNLDKGSH